jgi:hypothetical protein
MLLLQVGQNASGLPLNVSEVGIGGKARAQQTIAPSQTERELREKLAHSESRLSQLTLHIHKLNSKVSFFISLSSTRNNLLLVFIRLFIFISNSINKERYIYPGGGGEQREQGIEEMAGRNGGGALLRPNSSDPSRRRRGSGDEGGRGDEGWSPGFNVRDKA